MWTSLSKLLSGLPNFRASFCTECVACGKGNPFQRHPYEVLLLRIPRLCFCLLLLMKSQTPKTCCWLYLVKKDQLATYHCLHCVISLQEPTQVEQSEQWIIIVPHDFHQTLLMTVITQVDSSSAQWKISTAKYENPRKDVARYWITLLPSNITEVWVLVWYGHLEVSYFVELLKFPWSLLHWVLCQLFFVVCCLCPLCSSESILYQPFCLLWAHTKLEEHG